MALLANAAAGLPVCLGLMLSLLITAPAHGQTSAPVRFEVAAIRPGGDLFSTKPQRSGGRVNWTTQIGYLVGYAYQLDTFQVRGIGLGATYDMQATFAPSATDDQVRLMFQSLLVDRFKIRFHRATAQTDGYALSVAKRGAKLTKAGTSPKVESYVAANIPQAGTVAITGHKASLAELATAVQRAEQMPVWDRTALAGVYDFSFHYAQDPSAQGEIPSLRTALQNLGLSLRKQKGPLETLVIDNIEEPSAN